MKCEKKAVWKKSIFFPALKTIHKCSKRGKWFGPARTPGTPGTKGPRSRGPGRTGPRDLEGPVVLPGQDLETLKVLGTWRLGKSRDNGQPNADVRDKNLIIEIFIFHEMRPTRYVQLKRPLGIASFLCRYTYYLLFNTFLWKRFSSRECIVNATSPTS